ASPLGFEMVELESWQCCGAVFPLATDSAMPLVSPFRTLVRAHNRGEDLVTLCSACYNVLKRTNALVAKDEETRTKLISFVEEGEYRGEGRVVHFLEVLKMDVGFDAVKAAVKKPLSGIRVAPYYGCLLLRPQEDLHFDDPENPSILEDLMSALGAEVVDYPYKTECCGAYLRIADERSVAGPVSKIVRSAEKRGADVIVTSCPLCQYNLETKQPAVISSGGEGSIAGSVSVGPNGAKAVPVVYFTQLLALALGAPSDALGFDAHVVDPRPLLLAKNLMPEVA
ncbi:MAG TPA: disulfide reductase, partial [Clostridia bacterium]|nr:disulfide reductase [Clostridia bacterium]